MKICKLIFSLIVAGASLTANAQKLTDSLKIDIGTIVTAASKDFQPLWMKANRFGMISNQQFDASTYLEFTNNHLLWQLNEKKGDSSVTVPVFLSYGFTGFNNNAFRDLTIQQGYAEIRYKNWLFRAGRQRDLWDDLDPMLSSGSLTISGNALPVPKVTIALDNYSDVPHTNGWLQVKGMISHGWFGNNRFLESFLHQKSFYGRLGNGKLKFYGGVQHHVEWGGRRESADIQLERSLKGFFDVLFVKEANDGIVPPGSTKRPNRAGDQRGVFEFGAYWEDKKIKLHAYNQVPFESGKGISIKNIDRLAGLRLDIKDDKSFLRSAVLEFIYTKQMEAFDNRETQSYYNNGFYRTGWEYQGMVIGTPLFTNRIIASDYLPDIAPVDWEQPVRLPGNNNIINNRIIGANIGMALRFSDVITARTKLTPTMNYGARNYSKYYGNESGKFILYFLQEVSYTPKSLPWSLVVQVAADGSTLYSNTAGSIGLRYSLDRGFLKNAFQ